MAGSSRPLTLCFEFSKQSLQLELRHAKFVSLLAHHVQNLIGAFALGLDPETL
jgi:hypothetical protein